MPNAREATRVSGCHHLEIPKKSPDRRMVGTLDEWWSWRDLNPRPQALFGQIYMFSGLFWISLPGSRSRTLPWAPVPLSLASTQGTRVAAS